MASAFDPGSRAPIIAARDAAHPDPAPLAFAAAIAAITGAPVQVVAVYAGPDVLTPLAGGQLAEELPGDPADALDEAVGTLRTGGADADGLAVGAASAARGLDLVARETGAGLIVVGSAANAADGRVAAGSTARRLLDGAPCAVAVVPGGWGGRPALATVAVGHVEAAEAQAALRAGQALATEGAATLRIIAAAAPRQWMQPEGGGSAADDLRVRLAAAFEPTLAALVGVRADLDLLLGEPAEALLEASAEVDVLLVGSRAYGPTGATLLGGVGHALASGARCPLVVTARDAAVELTALVVA